MTAMDWNALVPAGNRLPNCPNQNDRSPGAGKPTHIILHITGTATLEPAKQRFMSAAGQASAHYIIDKDGSLYQLVFDGRKAWHSGIQTVAKGLYDGGAARWKQFLGLTLPRANYPADAVYLDANLRPTGNQAQQRFVQSKDGNPWPRFKYFEDRWGVNRNQPWNYEISKFPNDYSIGIELVSFGARTADPKQYTNAMYEKLALLVRDLCTKYDIPRSRGRVIGHEDVHPIDRFGWDPGAGFAWDRVLT